MTLRRRKDGGLSPQALETLRIAAEVNRLRRSDDLLADLRRDVRTSIGEVYLKSWWFYGPVVALIIAAGFAVVGVIELRGTRINVREEAEAALRAAKASIEEHKTYVEKSIDAIGKQAQSKADEAKQDVEGSSNFNCNRPLRKRAAVSTPPRWRMLKRSSKKRLRTSKRV